MTEPSARSARMHAGTEGSLPGLRDIRAALRRKRSVWISSALVGLLIGCSIHLFLPRKYAASSELYLVQPTGADPQQAISADASLAQTRLVAEEAITSLKLRTDPITFTSNYKAVVTGDDVLSIVYSGHSESQAQQYCNAVAQAFLHVRNSLVVGQIQGMIQGLQTESTSLATEITTVNNQIGALSASGGASSQAGAQEADLVNQRVSDESQVAQIQGQISQAYLESSAISQGSRILDPADGKPKSAKKILMTDGLSGLVAGLGGGALVVVILSLVSDRPRRRADISAALSAPVALSTPPWRTPRVLRWHRLRRRLEQPDQTLRTITALLQQYLETSTDDSLGVIAIGDVIPAAMAVCLLAQRFQKDHRRVRVIDLADDLPCHRLLPPDAIGGEGPLTYSTGTKRDGGERAGEARLVLATVDPARGAWQIATAVQDAVALVEAGRASSTQLHSTAQLLRVAEVNLRSVILLGSDGTDDTAGVAPILAGPARRHLTAGHGS